MSTAALLLILATTPQAPAPAPLAPRVEYFLVESRIVGPDGKALGALAGLTRREYRPSEATITETSLAVDPRPGTFPTVTVVDWTVADATATIRDRSGRMTGTARLVGPPWAWTEWSWTGAMRGVPGTFRNTAKATRRGVAIGSERIDESGKRLELFEEIDTRISKETYDLLRSKLLPQ